VTGTAAAVALGLSHFSSLARRKQPVVKSALATLVVYISSDQKQQ
jgi:hypothetical protein